MDERETTIKNAHPKTCKWLLRNSEYRHWLDATSLGDHHGFLWIKGKPGTGKSTLMKFAFVNARKTMKDSIVVSFFFNARGDDIEKSTVGTYRSLLLQLLERRPHLQGVFDSLGLSASCISAERRWSVESLKMLVKRAIHHKIVHHLVYPLQAAPAGPPDPAVAPASQSGRQDNVAYLLGLRSSPSQWSRPTA